LYKHWELIAFLCRQSRELPAFEVRQLLAAIQRFLPTTPDATHSDDEAHAILRALTDADILQPLGRSDDWQLNPLVSDFVRGLTHEHELGLSAVLKARINAMQAATLEIVQGTSANDMDLLNQGALKLSELLRQISQQLDQDRHAILELAEKAKSTDTSLLLAKRYRTVLEAYDQYVEPMNEMMDSSLGGTFYPYLEQATIALDRASEQLMVRGALYTQRQRLRLVAQQAKELRRIGRLTAQQCADTLLPLRDEVRLHNRLATNISLLLGQVRKRGLSAALRRKNAALPLWQRERRRLLHLGDEIRVLMAAARHYQPQLQPFPEALAGNPQDTNGWVDEAQLQQQLRQALPVENLMVWLREHYPLLPDATLLRLYHEQVREPAFRAQLQDATVTTELSTLLVHYHPHQLTASEQDNHAPAN
jgi:hypothetical protein